MNFFALGTVLFAATAHDENWSLSEIEIFGDRIVWRVTVGTQALEKAVRLPAPPVDLDEEMLRSVAGDVTRYLSTGMTVEIDGRRVKGEAGELKSVWEPFLVTGEEYLGSVTQEFTFRADDGISHVSLSVAFFATLTERHGAELRVTWDGETRVFNRIGPGEVELDWVAMHPSSLRARTADGARGFVTLVTGPAHVAFLLVLVLGPGVVRAGGAFVAATAMACVIAALGVVEVRPAVTGALMAASVAYVAAENVMSRDGRHRWVTALVFGLAHGLGLESVGGDQAGVTFALGAGMAQAAILLGMWALARRFARERREMIMGSTPIGLIGAAWLVEAIVGVDFMPLKAWSG